MAPFYYLLLELARLVWLATSTGHVLQIVALNIKSSRLKNNDL
jgi:hypothetical protein